MKLIFVILFYWWGYQGPQGLSKLSKGTQLKSDQQQTKQKWTVSSEDVLSATQHLPYKYLCLLYKRIGLCTIDTNLESSSKKRDEKRKT